MKKIIFSIVSLVVLCILILAINYVIFDRNGSKISKGRPITQKETKKQALLVIDIQDGITGKASTMDFFKMKSQELIDVTNRVIDSSARNNIPVIYVKNEISNPLINILNNSMAKGSQGAELDSRLRIVSDYVINKHKSDAFTNPLLDSILIKNEINRLVFTGLDLAQCVNSTIMAAVNRNYDICVISDAVIANPDSIKEVMLEKFKQSGFEIMSSEEYFERLQGQ